MKSFGRKGLGTCILIKSIWLDPVVGDPLRHVARPPHATRQSCVCQSWSLEIRRSWQPDRAVCVILDHWRLGEADSMASAAANLFGKPRGKKPIYWALVPRRHRKVCQLHGEGTCIYARKMALFFLHHSYDLWCTKGHAEGFYLCGTTSSYLGFEDWPTVH